MLSCRSLSSLPLVAWLVLGVNTQNIHSENTTLDALVGWEAGPNTRGTLTLVWSCVATIFACTWAVLHLNVPGIGDTAFRRLSRKIKWMVINILFPEFILSKAICDFRLALENLREFDKHLAETGPVTWTTAKFKDNSHEWHWKVKYPKCSGMIYRLLGLKPPCGRSSTGSMAYDDSEFADDSGICMNAVQTSVGGIYTGSHANVAELGQDEEASTRSRIDRWELEPRWKTTQKWTAVHSYYAQMGGLVYLDSLGDYTVLTATQMTSRFFWDTAEDNEHPLKYLILGEKDIQDKSKADWLVKGLAVLQITWIILSVIMRYMNGLPITQIEIATIAFSVMAVFIYLANWWKPKDISQPTILPNSVSTTQCHKLEVAYMQRLWVRLRSPTKAKEQMAEGNELDLFDSRVPNDLVWTQGDTPLIFVMMGVSSLVFGGLHCLAWNFEFPTRAELICWRLSSLTSTFLPMLALGINLIISHLSTRTQSRMLSALREKLRTLDDRLPWEWWEEMETLAFEARHDDGIMAPAAASAGIQHWEEVPSDEAISKSQADTAQWAVNGEDPRRLFFRRARKAQADLAQLMRESLKADEGNLGTQYSILKSRWGESWRACGAWFEIQGILPKTDDTKERSESASCESLHTPWLHLWRDYEDFVRHKLHIPAPQPPYASYSEQLAQAFSDCFFDDYYNPEEKFLRACDLASTIMTISTGIIYTAARLTIIALLFTCLRATPAGVYQITPWTKFIPKFS